MAEHPPHIGNFPALIKKRERVFFANIFAIVGLIAVAIIAIMGITHLGVLSSPWFSSFLKNFTFGSSSLSITAPSDVISNKPFSITWKNNTSDTGMYALSYPCEEGIGLDAQLASSSQPIPCGAAFTLGSNISGASFTPRLFATSTVQVPLTILFIPSATGTQKEASAKVSFHSDAQVKMTTAQSTTTIQIPKPTIVATTTSPVTPQTPLQQPNTPKVPQGNPDLVVRIVAVGVINPYTRAFVPQAPTSPEDTAAVQFDVANVGTAPTGPWRFTAHLPTRDGYAYYSPVQASLPPGGHIINTLQFTQTAAGLSVFSVMVNPDGLVRESNLNNNAATINISARY